MSIRIESDTNALDILNLINEELHEAELGVQFEIISEDDADYIEYELVDSDELIEY